MRNMNSIAFDPPGGSIQDALESWVEGRLEARFSKGCSTAALVNWCAEVQGHAIELLEDRVFEELRLRFRHEFEPKSHGQFTLRGTQYGAIFEPSSAVGAGTVVCRFRLAGKSEDEQRFSNRRGKLSRSLTMNRVLASAELSLKGFLPIVVDLAERVLRATNGWLLKGLAKLNRRSGSDALRAIRSLFKQEFGDQANEILIYAYGLLDDQCLATYLMDEELFDSVVDRIRRSDANEVPRCQQIAALLGTAMSIELTESRKALRSGEARPIPEIDSGRRYESQHWEFHRAEHATYGPGKLISHPVVLPREVASAQMIVCYPIRLWEADNGRIPKRIDELHPRIVAVVRDCDLVRPLLSHIRHVASADDRTLSSSREICLDDRVDEISMLRNKVRKGLSKYHRWPAPDGNETSIIRRLLELTDGIDACTNVELLRRMATTLSDTPSLKELANLEKLANER